MCLPFEELVSAEVEEVSIDKEKKRHSRIIYRFGGRKAIILFKLRKMTGRKHYQRRSLLLMKIHLCINPEKKWEALKLMPWAGRMAQLDNLSLIPRSYVKVLGVLA